MTKEEILHLGTLSRVSLSDEEVAKFNPEIDAILEYVGQVSEIVSDIGEKTAGVVHNVFREDEVTNEPGAYTSDIVAAFPDKQDNFLKVKKILNPDS